MSLFIPNLITGVKPIPGLFAAILAVTPFSEVVTPAVLAIGGIRRVKINETLTPPFLCMLKKHSYYKIVQTSVLRIHMT